MAIPLAATVVLACLTGCSSADRVPGEHPLPTVVPSAAPSASSSAAPSAFSSAVPRHDAALPDDVPTVAAPVRITVDRVGIDQPVRPEGVDATGAMALPPDPAVAGWYRYGAGPASGTGSTVIAAHVDAVGYGIGPFAHLVDVPAGTPITLTDAAGTTTHYAVTTVSLLRKTGVPWPSIFDRDGTRRLVLVTCGGDFDTTTHHYLSNLVVTATPTN
ncbi:class F sortase [Curtobacterium sp. PhB136]|uniref:class F sortase n=1 Tax=Curtobacterium sp. PhB136 TaxID=2485181 RepID=UPI0010EAB603|nr:class F sortase [Curtobacterium sp. PhB136]TCK60158.1 sortase family protein [Curtobacterium sp. PhB136]